MSKRILALILCLALCVSLIPAAAAESPDEVEIVGEEALLPPENEPAGDGALDIPTIEAEPAGDGALDIPTIEAEPAGDGALDVPQIDADAAPIDAGIPLDDEITLIDEPDDEPEAVPAPDAEPMASTVASGSCGDNLTWALYDNGTLTITGTGAMTDYERGGAPWYPYRSQINYLQFRNGITSIGAYAFSEITGMAVDVNWLPESLKSIGQCAFFCCYGITYVNIPSGVTTIGKQAFDYCTGIKHMTVGGTPTVDNRSFGCENLEEISFLGDALSFHNYTFRNTTAKVWYPSDNSTWSSVVGQNYAGTLTWTAGYHGWAGDNIYWDLNASSGALTLTGTGSTWSAGDNRLHSYYAIRGKVKSITVGEGITGLDQCAFVRSSNAASVSLPTTLTSIGAAAFNGCSSLTSLSIPRSVTELDGSICYGCSALTEVRFLGHAPTSISNTAFNGVSATVYYYPVYSWTTDNRLNYGGTLTWKLDNLIGDNVTWHLYDSGSLAINGSGATKDWPSDYPGFYGFRDEITSSWISQNITRAGTYLFYNLDKLEKVNIHGQTELGNSCFSRCTALKEIHFGGKAPASIGSSCFYNVTATAYYLPIADSGWTEDIMQNYGGDITWVCDNQVGDDVFWTMDSSGTVRLSGSGPTWDYDRSGNRPGFYYVPNDSVKRLVVGDGITKIGYALFADLQYISSVSLPETLTYIDGLAFFGCYALSSITIPKSVTGLGWQVFGYCKGLTTVRIEGAPSFHQAMFFNCAALTDVYFLYHAPTYTLASNTFYGDGSVTVHYFPVYTWTEDKLVSFTNAEVAWTCDDKVGDYSRWKLYESGLLQINGVVGGSATWDFPGDYPDFYNFNDEITIAQLSDIITRAGNYLFYNMDKLEKVYIQGQTELGRNCFGLCYALKEIFFQGKAPTFAENCFNAVTATAYYLPIADSGWTEDIMQNYCGTITWVCDNQVGDNVFWSLSSDGALVLTGTGPTWDYTYSDLPAYYDIRYSVKSLNVGDGITSIGDYLFYQMSDSIKSVRLPSTLTSIGSLAFAGMYGYTGLTIPASVTEIGSYAFTSNTALTEIRFLGHAPTSIDSNAFYNDTATVYYYPVYSWSEDKLQQYGGTLTWTKDDKIGDDVTWFLNDSGTVTIRGTGATWSYPGDCPGFWNFRGEVTEIRFSAVNNNVWEWVDGNGSGITKIGSYLLFGMDHAKKITLPATLEEIGYEVFGQCDSLETLIFCGYAPTFNNYAFDQLNRAVTAYYYPLSSWTADKLKDYGASQTVTWVCDNGIGAGGTGYCGSGYPEGQGANATWSYDESTGALTVSGTGATKECNFGCNFFEAKNCIIFFDQSCKKIVVEEGITTIGREMLSYMISVEKIQLPNTLTTIGRWAFVWCENCTEINLPDSLTSIQQGALQSMKSLKTVVIPSGVTKLEPYLLLNNVSMTTLNLPDTLTEICKYAVWECTALPSIEIPRGVKTIGEGAFKSCTALTEIRFLGHAPTSIDASAFEGVTATVHYYPVYSWTSDKLQDYGAGTLTWAKDEKVGDNVTWYLDENGLLTLSGTGPTWDFFSAMAGFSHFYEEISSAVVGEGVTVLGASIFEQFEGLTSVTLPSTLTTIGNLAFSRSGITEIIIPAEVMLINAAAFGGCASLTTIRFIGEAPSFASNCFKNVTATAWYPVDDPSWTEDVMLDYGGHITWKPYGGHVLPIANYTNGAAVCSLTAGGTYDGETPFTVTSDGDKAVLVLLRDGDNYTTLICTTTGGIHNFTVNVDKDDLELCLILKGDVTLDGKVESRDGNMVSRASVGKYTITNPLAQFAADVDGNGSIESRDGNMVSRAAVNKFKIKW